MNNEEKLICKICGRECKKLAGLSIHIVRFHKIQLKKYYDNYLRKDSSEGKCLECKKETKFSGLPNGYHKFCSTKCVANNKENKEKKKYTNKNKYGVDNIFKDVEYIKKCTLKKLGVENTSQSLEIKEKKRLKSQEKFGTDYPLQVEEVKEKIKQTNLKNSGIDNIFKDIEYIKKCTLKKLGVENASQLQKVKDKKIKISLKKFGVENPNQSEEIKEKKKQTNLEKYGVDNWAKTDQGKLFHRKNAINRIETQHNNNEPLCPTIGNLERECLDILESKFNNYIERNPNIDWLFPDGRILHLRLLIEYDEPGHYNHGYSQKDLKRENYLTSQGYIMFRIKQCDWKNNKEKVIDQFKSLIENLEKEYIK